MKNNLLCLGFVLIFLSCGTSKTESEALKKDVFKNDFTIAFGSCNKHNVTNNLWDDILKTNPDLWIWGGDNIYGDTSDMEELRSMYKAQNEVAGYKELKDKVPVIGIWDDHDYGKNDGGEEFEMKVESQKEFLDFMDVSKNSSRRSRKGIYAVHNYAIPQGKIKVLGLDTRYFRTALTKDTQTKKRNKPNTYGEGTILGTAQWQWLENELTNSDADFNIIVTSIQFLSNKHGFEAWGNFPHEVDKLNQLISDSKAKGVIVLSGDRHISEFSKSKIDGISYPLIDFTSSGLTHVYSNFSGEENPYRVGDVVFTKSFGVLNFDFKSNKVLFKMVGDNGKVLGGLEQVYK